MNLGARTLVTPASHSCQISLGGHESVVRGLLRSLFEKLDVAQCVRGNDSPDRASAVRCVHDHSLGVQDEVGCMEDFSPLLPVGPDLIGISWDLEAVGDGKIQFQLVDGLLDLV